ncbi:hypothetical protein niasHT_013259 [Heterodera trifolii]|uniref:Uncharacterized protein n=1 Tax=Heterodera trifolii TaxID=157864 RepID=A0ABD2LKF4_9BILA
MPAPQGIVVNMPAPQGIVVNMPAPQGIVVNMPAPQGIVVNMLAPQGIVVKWPASALQGIVVNSDLLLPLMGNDQLCLPFWALYSRLWARTVYNDDFLIVTGQHPVRSWSRTLQDQWTGER